MAHMVIANRLRDGLVVFRAADGEWVESIDGGELVDDGLEAERLLERSRVDEQHNLIIDPTLIPVTVRSGVRTPDQIREAIRATGPTIEVDRSDPEA